jgi:hypothetical protein
MFCCFPRRSADWFGLFMILVIFSSLAVSDKRLHSRQIGNGLAAAFYELARILNGRL